MSAPLMIGVFASLGKTIKALGTGSALTVTGGSIFSNLLGRAGVQIPQALQQSTTATEGFRVALTNVSGASMLASAKTAVLTAGVTLLNTVMTGLAIGAIALVCKALYDYVNANQIAHDRIEENIDTTKSNINSYTQQKNSLKDIAEEYDNLADKTNKSTKESERYHELQQQIADTAPDLVLGQNSDGSPILALNGSLEDYIDNLDRGGIKYSDSMNYPIECPDGTITYPNGRTEFINDGWIWTWGKEKLEWGLKNGFIVFRKSNVKSSGWGVYYKNYMFVNNKDELTERSAPHKNMITDVINTNASKDIKDMFGAKVFQYTKPKDLIKRLISFVNLKEDDIILDFFSGSSSTAHATMQLNAEDGGNRKFIMVQLPEKCDEKSEAYKAGYKNICEIGKERIRRAGEKIKEENKDKEGIEDLDVGFKVFRVGNTNIRWTSETVNSSTLDMFKNIENSFGEEVAAKAITPLEEEYYRNKDGVDFMPKAKDIDIVYEILLRQRDIHLSEKVELLSDIGERTYLFADSYLVCLEKTITKELIEKIASLDPLPIKFVFRDSAFEDNISLKDEAIRRLKALIDKNSEGNKVVYTVEFI